MAKKVRKISAEKFSDETSILPHVVAENVVREASALIAKMNRSSHFEYPFYDTLTPRSGIFRDQEEPVKYLANHALTIYAHNPDFRRQLRKNSGRDYLYSYMRHWISAETLLADLVHSMRVEVGHRGAYAAAAWPGQLSEWEATRGPTKPLFYVYEGGHVEEVR